MNHFWEILLGLDKGFLSRQGDWSWQFNPDWPGQRYLQSVGGASFYNLLLSVLGVALVIYVYRREAKGTFLRIVLAGLRLSLLALLILLLNKPTIVLEQERREPSVLAILIDDTLSMSVPDASIGQGTPSMPRIAAVQDLLTRDNAKLLHELAAVHDVKIYRFGPDALPVASIVGASAAPASQPSSDPVLPAVKQVQAITASEDGTQVIRSLTSVLQELQGQRLAGIVLLTDGHDTPVRERSEAVTELRQKFTVPIYPIAVGQDKLPQNIELTKPDFEPSAFVDDYTVIKFSVRATGFEPNHHIHVTLKKKDGTPAIDDRGRPIEVDVIAADDKPTQAEVAFMPARVLGLDPRRLPKELPPEDRTLNLVLEAQKPLDQVNIADNARDISIEVLDTQISVLFVDGYPRWEYRYLKNSLVRDKTMKVNCLLTDADPSFTQESTDGVAPIRVFPSTIDALLKYDVVIFGDVDQHQFTDAQLQLISDFVNKNGGGFGMVAGPRSSPNSYRNTPIAPILPVDISSTVADDSRETITQGYRPVLTPEGLESSIFQFYPDRALNKQYVEKQSPELFWYCHNVRALPQATVLSEHPSDLALGTVRKAPLMVVSQFGAGRTLFSAVDDSWRWRFYTGENIFNTFWVQQIRYLARNRKLDQRSVSFEPDQTQYELGKAVTLDLSVLNPQLNRELAPTLPVQILDAAGTMIKQLSLDRVGDSSRFRATWVADQTGRFTAQLAGIGDAKPLERPFLVQVPQLELESPQVDRSMLSSLGQGVDWEKAADELPKVIHSAAKTIPIDFARPLWDAPLALFLFTLLITAEWIVRKMHGML